MGFRRRKKLRRPALIDLENLGEQIGQWMHLKKAEEQLKKLNLKIPG